MGWFLLRKPYPGLQEEDRIDITHDAVLLGRGRECSKHCLSIFVSRRHVQLTPKDDGSLNIRDLGSSNGTFVNQLKIDPNVEWPLKVGDEIGIGNVNSDNKDCYVYQVHLQDSSKDMMKDSSAHHQSSPKEQDIGDQCKRHPMEKGLKRFAPDPDIVIIEDYDYEKEDTVSGKRSKNDCMTVPAIQDDLPESDSCDKRPKQERPTPIETVACLKEEDSNINSSLKHENLNLSNADSHKIVKPVRKSLELQVLPSAEESHMSTEVNVTCGKSANTSCSGPDTSAPTFFDGNVREPTKKSLSKPVDRRLSALLDEDCDVSSGTVKLSSPSPFAKSVTMPSCSTPNLSNNANPEKLPLILPSPLCIKSETSVSCISKSANMSPIEKEVELRHSQSSFNYTLDDEMIPIDVSDDEESFPCSQMFAEDVKPCIADLAKEVDIVDLSHDEDCEVNKAARDDDMDLIVIGGSSDEDEDDIADADRWFKRLSQSSTVKVEVADAADEQTKEEAKEVETNQNLQNVLCEEDLHHISDEELELLEINTRKQEGFVNETDDIGDDNREEEVTLKKKLKSTSEDIREGRHHKHRSKHKKKEKERERSKGDQSHRKHEEPESDKQKKRHSKHESSKQRENIVDKLRSTFCNSTDEEESLSPQHGRKGSSESPPKVRNDSAKMSDFDQLLQSHNQSYNKESERPVNLNVKEPYISLNRLENDAALCEQYNISSPSSLPIPSSSVTIPKKPSRRTEYVEALPNPPRKACNRGISSNSTIKLYKNDKLVEKRSTHDSRSSKPPEVKDPKTLRKEKLAQVAAMSASKGKGSSDGKRAAPARVKNTESNRGSFLTEDDEDSSKNKLKSRIDIIKSSKIPKIKDKVAPSYPSKSPLQSMNLSWERDKPVASTSSTSPPQEPVEIPTGPQPKKRVAQVPPVGFYRDASPLPETTTSAMKSCLSSSSKHNISLNKPKPNKKKKTVRFKENLVEVFLIDPIDRTHNTKSVNSYKDADRPKAMSQVPSIGKPQAMVLPNDETILQDVIYDICKWNPLWLKEEKDLPPDTLPPVVSNMNLPTIPRTEFLDFQEYHSSMYPLLMLELWNGVSKEYNNIHCNNSMTMAVDHASSSTVASRPDRMLTTLRCHLAIYGKNAKDDYPKRGYLVMIDLRLKDSSGKPCIVSVFGYVEHEVKEKASHNTIFHKDLVRIDKLPAFKVRFTLLIRERKNYTYVLEKPMLIKNVKYIRGDLRVFVAMKNLQHMPLRYSIISPNAGNEDMSLPDVSKTKLALPEPLNPTQEKIVLQTGEVCQQHKPKICLIQGPPGTGKSHVIASLVLQLLYRDKMYTKANRENGLVPRILLCAPSNTAVDVLVKRLLRKRGKMDQQHRFKMVRVGNDAFMHPDVKGISLFELAKVDVSRCAANDNIQIEISNLEARLQGIHSNFTMQNKPIPNDLKYRQADYARKLKVLQDRLKQQSKPANPDQSFAVKKESMKKILRGADIVATTLNSCVINIMETVFSPTNQPNKYNFQVCIVDEATQCLEVETLIPLMLGVKTLVLVGDHNQLPATVLSKAAKEKGLGTSLFARLQKVVPDAVQVLDTQYRMHPEILKWPNKYFYGCNLKTPVHLSLCRESKIRPYTIISLPFQQNKQGESNFEEAKLVLLLAELLVERKVILPNFRIGIVTPYRSQLNAIQALKQRLEVPWTEFVEINTIDSYQGQEKDIIIFSCVRTSGIGFLSDRQRLNVALTRAKYGLFICGNFSSLDRDPMWNNLLTDARHRECIVELRNQHNNKEDLWNLIKKQ